MSEVEFYKVHRYNTLARLKLQDEFCASWLPIQRNKLPYKFHLKIISNCLIEELKYVMPTQQIFNMNMNHEWTNKIQFSSTQYTSA